MISDTGQNGETSLNGAALTGFLEIPSIAELLSGMEWNLKETMRYVFPGNGTKKRQKLITSRNARSRHGMSLPVSTGYPVF